MIRRGRVVAIVQARMASTRLPGKVLRSVAGRPMLEHVVRRVQACELIDEVVVATSSSSDDAAVSEWCKGNGVPCFRGAERDVLARFVGASRAYNADVIVRVTADCPLADPALIADVLERYDADAALDYVANRLGDARTFPMGLDVEVFSAERLHELNGSATEAHQREHVTPAFYDGSHPSRCAHVRCEREGLGELRWTVDTAEDLAVVAELLERVPDTHWTSALEVYEAKPRGSWANCRTAQKSYRDVQRD